MREKINYKEAVEGDFWVMITPVKYMLEYMSSPRCCSGRLLSPDYTCL